MASGNDSSVIGIYKNSFVIFFKNFISFILPCIVLIAIVTFLKASFWKSFLPIDYYLVAIYRLVFLFLSTCIYVFLFLFIAINTKTILENGTSKSLREIVKETIENLGRYILILLAKISILIAPLFLMLILVFIERMSGSTSILSVFKWITIAFFYYVLMSLELAIPYLLINNGTKITKSIKGSVILINKNFLKSLAVFFPIWAIDIILYNLKHILYIKLIGGIILIPLSIIISFYYYSILDKTFVRE